MGARRASVVSTSRSAAAAGEVTMPMARGNAGSGFLARRLEQSFGLQARLQLLEGLVQRAQPGLAHLVDAQLVVCRAARRASRARAPRPAGHPRDGNRGTARATGTSRNRPRRVESFSAKYQWPDGAFLTLESSPATHKHLELVLEQVARAPVELRDADDGAARRGRAEAVTGRLVVGTRASKVIHRGVCRREAHVACASRRG